MSRFALKPIVVPWDYQEMSLESLQVALELAGSKDQVEVIHVREFPKGVQPGAVEGLAAGDTQKELQDKFIEQVSVDLQDLAFTVIMDFDSDHGVEIARFAELKDAGLIVIGSHGRKGLSRLVLGSVANNVVQHSKCPVLVVRQ